MHNSPPITVKKWEVADVLRLGIQDYRNRYGRLSPEQNKVVNALKLCRTSQLGGHTYSCDCCDYKKHVYNSCRNRHCPKCQGLARIKWVESKLDDLLPVQYFHAVFTIPSELNPFALRNKKAVYTILQKSVADTLNELSKDKKHLDADIGFISVLHTWGQNVMDHPHVHCIIPGGGIRDKRKWKSCKKDFLFPIRVMSRLFKGKFMDAFKKAVDNGSILFHGNLKQYCDHSLWKCFINDLYSKEWVVYCKKPFAGPEQVVKYLGGYTHRIAISNHRIIDVNNKKVTFRWKSYADNNKTKAMTVSTVEFVRRFLLHVLPSRYQRIRYYGILANRNRKKALALCFKLLGKIKRTAEIDALELFKNIFGIDLTVCPECKQGNLIFALPSTNLYGGYS